MTTDYKRHRTVIFLMPSCLKRWLARYMYWIDNMTVTSRHTLKTCVRGITMYSSWITMADTWLEGLHLHAYVYTQNELLLSCMHCSYTFLSVILVRWCFWVFAIDHWQYFFTWFVGISSIWDTIQGSCNTSSSDCYCTTNSVYTKKTLHVWNLCIPSGGIPLL